MLPALRGVVLGDAAPAYLVKVNFAVCVVPSSSVSANVPHLPAHVFTVFHT